MRCAIGAVLALSLTGCLSAPIQKADDALKARVDGLEKATEKALSDADSRVRERIGQAEDATERLTESVDRRLRESVADLDARLDRQRTETLAALKVEREAILAKFAEISSRVVDESAAWRAESAHWRTAVAPALEFVGEMRTGSQKPGHFAAGDPAHHNNPGSPTGEDQLLGWAGVAGLVLTVGKTALRLWRSRNQAGAAS